MASSTLVETAPKHSGLTEYSTQSPIRSPTTESKYSSIDPSLLLPDGTPDYLKLILTSRVYDVCERNSDNTGGQLEFENTVQTFC